MNQNQNDFNNQMYNPVPETNVRVQKKKNGIRLNWWQVVLFVLFMVVVVSGIMFASSSSLNSKKLYTGVLDKAIEQMNKNAEMLQSLSELDSGIYTKKSKNKVTYTGSASYWYDESDNKDEEEEYEVQFNGEKYFISTKDFNALWDKLNEKLFVQKVENGKPTGDVKELDGYLSYYITSELEDYLPNNSFSNSSSEIQLKGYKAYAMILESIKKNLKDSYFIDRNVDGVHEYRLELNKQQAAELVENVCNDLINNKELLDLLSMTSSQENLKESLKEAVDAILDLDNFEIGISVFAKGDIKNLTGVKFNYRLQDDVTLMDLAISKQEITLKVDSKFHSSKIDWYTLDTVQTEEKMNLNFSIKTNDNKEFENSTDIVGSFKVTVNDESHSVDVMIKGDSDKSLDECSKISASLKFDDESFDDIVTLYTNDKKALNKTSEAVFEIKGNKDNSKNLNFDSFKIVIKAMDDKELLKTSDLKVNANMGNENMDLFRITAKDKKSLAESNEVEFVVSNNNGDDIKVNIKINDKKGLMNISKSTDIEISSMNTIDYTDYDVNIRIKSNKELASASKINVEFVLKSDVDNITLKAEMESLDGNPITKCKKFKFNASMDRDDKNYTHIKMNSNSGYEIESRSCGEGIYSNYDRYSKEEFKFKKGLDIEKLMNTNNTIKATSDEVRKILDPSYEPYDYSSWLSNYDYDYDYDDESNNDDDYEMDSSNITVTVNGKEMTFDEYLIYLNQMTNE